MIHDIQWPRLMVAIVESVADLRDYPTRAGAELGGVGEATMRGYFERYDDGDWADFVPRGRTKRLLLAYADRTWSDWRERFAIEAAADAALQSAVNRAREDDSNTGTR